MGSANIFSPSEEHELLRKNIRRFVEAEIEPGARERDEKEQFDETIFQKLGELGFLGVSAEEEFGGSGLDASAAVIIHEEISASDPGLGLAYLAHSMLCINNISVNASKEQKEKYLPKLCTGEHLGAMAMSEPEAGTDVLAMKTWAEKKSGAYSINGRKMWITNGTKADGKSPCDVLFLYARTNQNQNSMAGISSFIVSGEQSGFAVGQKLNGKLGMRASTTAELVFEDLNISEEHRVGEEGDSLLHMMRNLEIERLTLAAMGLGISRRCLAVMNQYANDRKAFGEPIIKFGQIQKYIAESYAKYKACRAYIYNLAYNMKLNRAGGRVDSDAVKLLSATFAKEIADAAIQVLGGNGYMAEFVVERLWRDAKLLEIGGGTIEAHQKNIALDLRKKPQLIFEP